MSDALPTRLGMLLGLAVAAAAATWWLAATRLALGQAMGTAGIAASALAGLWLARALLLGPFALRAGALHDLRNGTASSLALVIAAWPVVLAAASAGTRSAVGVVVGEIALLVAALVLPAVGHGLRVLLRSPGTAVVAGTVLGGALAAALWMWGSVWTGVNG
jgi:hypothetical protein